MVGHRLMGTSLMQTGQVAEGRAHLDQAMGLCEANNRPLATRFGIDVRISILCYRSWALWMLGYPEAALADAERALNEVRQIDQAAMLMYALLHLSLAHMFCGRYESANAEAVELLALAEKKDAPLWKASGMMNRGDLLALVGNASDAVPMIVSGIAAYQSTGATIYIPGIYRFWHWRMGSLANLIRRGAVALKPSQLWKQPAKDGWRPRSIGPPVKSL